MEENITNLKKEIKLLNDKCNKYKKENIFLKKNK